MKQQDRPPTGKRDHSLNKLSPISLKSLPAGSHADGGNLYLLVRGNSRAWVFYYTSPTAKKRRKMGLGPLDSVSLAEARVVAAGLRAQVKHPINPIDPIIARKEAKAERQRSNRRQITFKQACKNYIESKQSEWTNAKHLDQWKTTFETYVEPFIGHLSVAEVDTPLIIKIFNQEIIGKNGDIEGTLWTSKTPTAKRLLGRIESVLNWAKASGYRDGENPAAWRGHIQNLLANPNKINAVVHQPSLPYKQVGDFMVLLKGKAGMGARALEFLIMTGVRPGSVLKATWDQIDFDELVWNIPAENTKKKVDFSVPLTPQMVTLLEALPILTQNNHLFPGSKKNALSDMALSEITRGMLEKKEISSKIVPHGFRSTSRTWAAEQTSFPDEIRKAFGMHKVSDSTKESYERTDFFDKRRELTIQWCNYLDLPSVRKQVRSQCSVVQMKATL